MGNKLRGQRSQGKKRRMRNMEKHFIFDVDGTLIDSADDTVKHKPEEEPVEGEL